MITDIDMTSAFDTFKRAKLTEILESFLREDEIHLIRIFLSNTTLDIKSSSIVSNPFETNIGSPQSDGLRGCLFLIYLKRAQGSIHNRIDNNHVTDEHHYAVSFKGTQPGECICVDNTDLINGTSEKNKRQL